MLPVAIVLLIFVALLIPITAIVIDSPLGRSIARRMEQQGGGAPSELTDLRRKVDLLEGEVEDLHRSVTGMKDELQFFQRLLEKPKEPPA